ncbi:polymorphic toxin type 33 domain-containing protein, partial [Zooshikella harenae]
GIPTTPVGSLKNRNANWLKRQGVDPHKVKAGIGDSRLDIYVDKADNIWTMPKKGQGGVPQWQGTLDMFKDGG